jgi:hypothetical protein
MAEYFSTKYNDIMDLLFLLGYLFFSKKVVVINIEVVAGQKKKGL